MKKKILVVMGALALAMFVNFNINIFNDGISYNIDLTDLINVQVAEAEGAGRCCNGGNCDSGYDQDITACCHKKGQFTGDKQ